mgnify:CR=1 FL=1
MKRSIVFQTDPCGIEAATISVATAVGRSFRRTLVGLKPATRSPTGDTTSFRRTLVGLKHGPGNPETAPRSTFQTDPCGIEAISGRTPARLTAVSDGPLWD